MQAALITETAFPDIPYGTFPAPSLAEDLRLFVEHGVQPGGSLMALLRNDVRSAFAAGPTLRAHLGDMLAWFDDNLPICCHGSRAIVDRWLARHAQPDTSVPTFADPLPHRPPWPAAA